MYDEESKVKGIFGFDGEDHIGKIVFPAVQAAPGFPTSFPHIVFRQTYETLLLDTACNRMTRDVAPSPKLRYRKPALIESTFYTALQGETGKMSASDRTSAIYVTDSEEVIEKKMMKYAFSGGGSTKAEPMQYGADLEKDVSIEYLSFFLKEDRYHKERV
ncbi:Tryptophan--tRNA ligase, cytoplasmic [Thalictrum thalictroides]|uniref:Tryptophanyl-tRNA synthetase n=1 Tax=Thalictrum thalictroides TaxID=46969 RepID=A0A7J6WA72_THATH|nr:Tryptophan--tRNA ligase, cytoplasmic [Thalictrum thalictroides]